VRVKCYDKSITALINAHESAISFLCLNRDGTILATASDKGTLIRIFKVESGIFLQELRRGAEKAEIYSVAFDFNSNFLACSSDRGTIHIFSLATAHKKLKEINEEETQVDENKDKEDKEPKNQKSLYYLYKIVGGDSLKSFLFLNTLNQNGHLHNLEFLNLSQYVHLDKIIQLLLFQQMESFIYFLLIQRMEENVKS
jgi:WD40 repeat protein